MKITDEKKTIKPGLPNMRQALFYAYNDPTCQAATELHILPETAVDEGKGEPPKGKEGSNGTSGTGGGGASGTGGRGSTATGGGGK
jgi:hypothetical protein